jgi:hypothetical protein
MLRHVALVRSDVSEELSTSIIRVTRIGELGTTLQSHFVFLWRMHQLLVTANVSSSPILFTLMMEALSSSETSVLTRATWHNIPEYSILHGHHHENLKSYNMDFLFFFFQMISDFDRTLTKQHVDGKPTLSSFCTYVDPRSSAFRVVNKGWVGRYKNLMWQQSASRGQWRDYFDGAGFSSRIVVFHYVLWECLQHISRNRFWSLLF